jgi:hypothetical protein
MASCRSSAPIIAFQKTVPWPRAASYGAAAVLAVLSAIVLIAPTALQGLTTSGGAAPMGM